ncbi:hypothetical protein E8E13_002312 [Curvularia kusanoi]|uniref:GAT domain-containing protein n=1 Tax=Curvularia kusanoi TaxID=90978 RepID=A0A9P4T9L4_CURKU|nr:hypothetical protein E8E13_002312 [Curvularia kusanoi]
MALKKRLGLGSLMRKKSSQDVPADSGADTPDANAARGVRLFCESGAANSGEEVLHLPTIVEAAESSPQAAAAAATQIRKFLSKENYTRPHVQYNAIMLIRILADNPGPSFTKNLDKTFADTVKHLLRNGTDPSVAQILRETLDALERDKAFDTNLNVMFAMWKKEKGLMANAAKQFGPRRLNAPGWAPSQQFQGGFSSGGGRSHSRGLPPPVELAGRIEEARTSAKLLLQLVQSTPPNELIGNELVKEFSERCTSAQRSIQGYIACDNPAPDDDTMLTLIETNEQLSLAASKHQRAILQARRAMGASPSPTAQQTPQALAPPPSNDVPSVMPTSSYEPPPGPPPRKEVQVPSPMEALPQDPYDPLTNTAPYGTGAPQAPPAQNANTNGTLPPSLQAAPNRQSVVPAPQQDENPFADHYTSTYTPPTNPRSNGYGGSPESYHPGYQSTPSYLHRQESSANNLTMHGAAIAEEEGASQRPRTPDANGTQQQQQQQHDVSPIAERNTVTYRY